MYSLSSHVSSHFFSLLPSFLNLLPPSWNCSRSYSFFSCLLPPCLLFCLAVMQVDSLPQEEEATRSPLQAKVQGMLHRLATFSLILGAQEFRFGRVTHPHTHTHTSTHTHSSAHTLSPAHPHSPAYTHSHQHTHTLISTHTHTSTPTLTSIHPLTPAHPHSPAHTLTPAHTHQLAHTHTSTPTHSPAHTLTPAHPLTPAAHPHSPAHPHSQQHAHTLPTYTLTPQKQNYPDTLRTRLPPYSRVSSL